jgi:uncharacterized membrane protein HdeD (DUF308 family)
VGVLAVVVGVIALAWPSVTVLALVILFAVYAFPSGGTCSSLADRIGERPLAPGGRPGRSPLTV